MDTNRLFFRRLSKIALAALSILLVLGGVFYKERALFADASWRLFDIINFAHFLPPGNRYGSFIVQILPYLAREFHLSTNTIIFCYSVSFNLFYLIVAFIILKYRQYLLLILMALYYFLFISESYIWVSEAPIGIAWMFLFFAVTLYLGEKKVNLFLLLVSFTSLAFLAVFSHFAVVIPLVFIWVLLLIEKKNWPFERNITILLNCLLIAVIAVKFFGSDTQKSDGYHLYGITHFSIKDIINSFTTPVVGVFLYRCVVNYWVGIFLLFAGLFSFIRFKQTKLAIWTVVSLLGYLIIMGLTYGDLDEHVLLFHIESEWAPIGIIVSYGFVFSFLPKIKLKVASFLLTAIFIIRLVYIGIALPSFTDRIRLNEQTLALMKKKGINKLAIINDKNLMTVNKLYWGLPYESIMMSSMNGDKPERSFFYVNPDNKAAFEAIKNKNELYTCFGMMPSKDLNPGYFVIDTTQPYQVMTYSELFK